MTAYPPVFPPPVTSPGWSSRTKRIVLLICLALIAYFVARLTSVLPIVTVSLVVSYLLNPIVTAIDRRILSRGRDTSHRAIAILLAFVIVIAILVLVMLLVVPILVDQLQEFLNRLPELFAFIQTQIDDLLSHPITIGTQVIVPSESLQEALGIDPASEVSAIERLNVGEAVRMFAGSLSGPAFGFVGSAVRALINLFLLVTLMFYLLKDGGTFVDRIVGVTPASYQNDVRRLFYELARVWDAYLRGQITLSLIMGAVVFLAAAILGVPNPPILGMLAGLLEFLPNIGPAIALVPAVLLAVSSQSSTLPFLEGPTFAIVVTIVWTLLQNLESVFLVPRIMGGSLNLHPFVVLVGVLAGAALAGLLGIVLAAPVIASLRVIGRYLYGKLMDIDPFPPPDPRTIRDERRKSWGHRLGVVSRYLRRMSGA